MKSKLFSTNPMLSKDFAEDLKDIIEIKSTPQLFKIFPRSLSRYLLAKDAKTETDALEELRLQCELTPKEMQTLLSIGTFFLKNMDVDDTVENVMEDLGTILRFEGEALSKLQPYIEALLNECITEFDVQKTARETQLSGLKIIKGLTHLVDLRSIVKNRIKAGDNIEEYSPEITTLVPVAILKIRLSQDEECVFQMSQYGLSLLQDELEAARKELDAMIAFVGSGKITIP